MSGEFVVRVAKPQKYPVLETELVDGVYVVPDRRETGQAGKEEEE